MMRRIEFRGFNINKKTWVYGNLITDENNNKYIIEPKFFSADGHHLSYYDPTDEPVLIDPKTIGQYTGFCDKKGNKIYENDIILDNSYGYDVGQLINVVIWNDKIGGWTWGDDDALIAESLEIIEVIGNSHENSSLLSMKG
jgi:uncharacterized phage protein (TIGR01671 family)